MRTRRKIYGCGLLKCGIIQVVIRKLEKRYGQDFMEEINKSMKLIRYEPGRLFLEVEKIAERERPSLVEIPEYMQRHHRQ